MYNITTVNDTNLYLKTLPVYWFPANTKHLHNICTTSAQRLRRWPNIVQVLYKGFVFAWLRYQPRADVIQMLLCSLGTISNIKL